MAHAVLEVKKFHDLPNPSWRTRKAGDVTQSPRLENEGANVLNPDLSTKAQKPEEPMFKGKRR